MELTATADQRSFEGGVSISIGLPYLKRGLAGSYPKLAAATRPLTAVREHQVVFPLKAELRTSEAISSTDRLRAELGACFQAAGCAGYGPRTAAIPVFMALPAGADRLEFEMTWVTPNASVRVSNGTLSGDAHAIRVQTINSSMGAQAPSRRERLWVQHNVEVPIGSPRRTQGTLRIRVQRAWQGDAEVLSDQDAVVIELPVEMSR